MNFESVVMYLLFSVILSALLIAVIAYVKHWAKRQISTKSCIANTQGYYFKRYVPPSLYQKFDPEKMVGDKSITRIRVIERTLILSIVMLGLMLVSFPLYMHMDKNLRSESIVDNNKIDSNNDIATISKHTMPNKLDIGDTK
jgi:cell division protein FtsL